MTDHFRGRARRDDSLIPLVTFLVVVAAFGPAAYTAATQWLVPRLTAGQDAVSVSMGDWIDRNWWLVLFWVLELALLFGFLGWSRRRRRRRDRQMEFVVTGLARALPTDWEPERHLRVLRWNGHRPVRLRLQLTPPQSAGRLQLAPIGSRRRGQGAGAAGAHRLATAVAERGLRLGRPAAPDRAQGGREAGRRERSGRASD